MKQIFLSVYIFFFFTIPSYAASAEEVFGLGKVTPNLQNGGSDLVQTADNILGYLIGLLYFISVVFALYAGFTILTSGGDEEKVKKGKQILIYVVIGLVVIFLASQIVSWVIGVMGDRNIVGGTVTP